MNANTNFIEYLGSDGKDICQSYNLYLQKCEAFIAKARRRKAENERLKNSVIHSNVPGYESDEESDEEYLSERRQHLKEYKEAYDVTRFDGDDENSKFENFTPKTKEIRIVRDISEPLCFGSVIPKSIGDAWVWRFCMLSKFIQAARMIILKRRMEKRLEILRHLTPAMINELEGLPPPEIQEPEPVETVTPCELMYPFCLALCNT